MHASLQGSEEASWQQFGDASLQGSGDADWQELEDASLQEFGGAAMDGVGPWAEESGLSQSLLVSLMACAAETGSAVQWQTPVEWLLVFGS